jgi:hypothetical protein
MSGYIYQKVRKAKGSDAELRAVFTKAGRKTTREMSLAQLEALIEKTVESVTDGRPGRPVDLSRALSQSVELYKGAFQIALKRKSDDPYLPPEESYSLMHSFVRMNNAIKKIRPDIFEPSQI